MKSGYAGGEISNEATIETPDCSGPYRIRLVLAERGAAPVGDLKSEYMCGFGE